VSDGAVLLFGAGGATGLELARLLRGNGVDVIAMLRSDAARPELERLKVRVVSGDAWEPADVARAFQAAPQGVSVVSLLGGRREAGRLVDEVGNGNVIDAAAAAGSQRFVLVTAIGCGEMAPYRSAPAIAAFGDVVDAKTRAEERLRASSLSWSIVRPGGLRAGTANGRGILTQDPEVHGFIRRANLALLIEQLLRSSTGYGRALAAVDSDEARCVRPLEPFRLA
jgi:uncharacterized protein YbjT (DUF2867 family)